jgi:hypothetical protein
MLVRMHGQRTHIYCWWEISVATIDISMEVPQKTKNESTLGFCYTPFWAFT